MSKKKTKNKTPEFNEPLPYFFIFYLFIYFFFKSNNFVLKDTQASLVQKMSTIVLILTVGMVHVSMECMITCANATKVTPDVTVRQKSTSVTTIHVNMEGTCMNVYDSYECRCPKGTYGNVFFFYKFCKWNIPILDNSLSN